MSFRTTFRSVVFFTVAAIAGSAMAQWTGTNPVTVPSGTTVGVGTSTPEASLHILAPSTASQLKVTSTTSSGSNISLFVHSNRTESILFDADFTSSPTAGFRMNAIDAVWVQKASSHFRFLGATTSAAGNYATLFTNLYDVDIATGNTGIGGSSGTVANPSRLDVVGTALTLPSSASRRVTRLIDATAMTQGVGAGLDFMGKYDTTGNYTQFANLRGTKSNATSGDFGGKFAISVNNSAGTLVDVASVDTTGITITGNITASGSITGATVINAVYQDVAEWVPASTHMEPGTVVVLNRERTNEVMPSAHAYDTAVAGVVSAQPGVVLGVPSDSKAQIATTGRVKVHVDATAGPIAVGDLLVTSDKTGTAMKSQPVDLGGVQIHRPGTVIGKALQPLANGQGEILVLLSLQ